MPIKYKQFKRPKSVQAFVVNKLTILNLLWLFLIFSGLRFEQEPAAFAAILISMPYTYLTACCDIRLCFMVALCELKSTPAMML